MTNEKFLLASALHEEGELRILPPGAYRRLFAIDQTLKNVYAVDSTLECFGLYQSQLWSTRWLNTEFVNPEISQTTFNDGYFKGVCFFKPVFQKATFQSCIFDTCTFLGEETAWGLACVEFKACLFIDCALPQLLQTFLLTENILRVSAKIAKLEERKAAPETTPSLPTPTDRFSKLEFS